MIDINAWQWPQWFYLGMTFVGLLGMAYEHGKPKDGYNNFWAGVFATSPAWVCLYYGGFFK
jgi:hypothetical protein